METVATAAEAEAEEKEEEEEITDAHQKNDEAEKPNDRIVL